MIGKNPTSVKKYRTKLSYRDEMWLKGHSRDEVDRLAENKRKRDDIERRLSLKAWKKR